MIRDYIFYGTDYCLICKSEKTKTFICRSCMDNFELVDGLFEADFGDVYYPLFYNNFLREIIWDFKFKKKSHLVKPLVYLLIRFIENKGLDQGVSHISYVPMHRVDEFKRGYNQAEVLAYFLSINLDIPLVKIIEKARRTEEQNKLDFSERKENIKNSFRPIEKIDHIQGKILFIDDIVTTGASLGEIDKCLDSRFDLVYLTLTSGRFSRG